MKLQRCSASALLVAAHVSADLVVSGVKVDSANGAAPLRQSINDLQTAGGAQWDLYIRALQAMYDADSSNPLSFFQIAGIHGKPYVEWGETGAQNATGWRGYCPHGEKLFLPWHRPLVLLFEQTLVDHAKRIAQEYPQRYKFAYTTAAETLRAPFWDWASDPQVPLASIPDTLKINMPSGGELRPVDIKNPLSTFHFPQVALDGNYGPFDSSKRSQTYRCRTPKTYPASANQNLAGRPYKQWTYDAFTKSKHFSEFGSTAGGGMSLELIHNGIHWDAACGEQFVNAEFSGFDPLFMLHHSNVDRLWAYWQAMRPNDSTFQVPYKGGSRFTSPGGTTISPDSPLQPFLKPGGGFHTSRSVNSLQGFGYSYRGLEYWQKSPDQMRQDATQIVNSLYSPTYSKSLSQSLLAASRTRYFARVSVDVTQLERPCEVNVFVDGMRAASMVVMNQPTSGIANGLFSLDDAVKGSDMRNAAAEQTVASIKLRVQVEIVKPDGSLIPLSSAPSLRVDFEDVTVTPPKSGAELPTFSAPRLHKGRPLR